MSRCSILVQTLVLSVLFSCLCNAESVETNNKRENPRLDTVLNQNSMTDQYKYYWNKDLDLVKMVSIKLEDPFNTILYYVPGTKLGDVDLPTGESWDTYHWLEDDSCSDEKTKTTEALIDTTLKPYLCLTVATAAAQQKVFLNKDDSIFAPTSPCGAGVPQLLNGHKVVNKKTEKELPDNEKIVADMEVVLKNNVSCVGEFKASQLCTVGAKISDCFSELKTYFDSENYIVGDSDSNDIITADTIVEKDIIINVMKQFALVLEYDGNDTAVDEGEIAQNVADMLGIDAGEVKVKAVFDDNNNLVTIFVYLGSYEEANKLKDKIDNKAGNCGVVCKSKSSYIKTPAEKLSEGFTLHSSIFVSILSALVMMILNY